MSNRDNFAGGFFAGAIVGGVVGGIIGAAVTAARYSTDALPEEAQAKPKRRAALKAPVGKNIEVARRGLEDKIAQLNDAIDDVRQQLGNINGNGQLEESDQPITREL